MKALYYDCFSGISGDMNLGAMIDLGVDPAYLIRELTRLGLEEEYEISIRSDKRKGIAGKRVEIIPINKIEHERRSEQADQHSHSHGHGHSHGNGNGNGHSYGHAGVRTLADIENMILQSSLSLEIKNLSMKMFTRLAEAEAAVHGVDINEVHFHEVGAVDSILDIVGAAICLEALQVGQILASPVELGGGFVRCHHGLLPVPVPAVTALLQGIPIKTGKVPYETTTPTGAVILAVNVQQFTPELSLSIEKVGYGIGKRDTEIPNVLRVFLGEMPPSLAKNNTTTTTTTTKAALQGTVVKQIMIETNMDDMNPEIYGYVEEKLFAGGALDVFATPIIMKKGRPAVKLSVLSGEGNVNTLKEIIFRDTSAIGLRSYTIEKTMLRRESREIETKFGSITVKFSYLHDEMIKYKAEYEECRKIAVERNISINDIYREVTHAVEDMQRIKTGS